MQLEFSSKAQTLERLQGRVKSAKILPLFWFSTVEWKANPNEILRNIREKFGNLPLIIRSSCTREDGQEASNAGAFHSALNVTASMLSDSIDCVISSYGFLDESDEVLVQPMLTNVTRSGVGFSHDPNTCGPYRLVSWADGEDTSLVTGGVGGMTWQQAAESVTTAPTEIVPVVILLEELLELFGGQPIDCEFAFTEDSHLWLLQARKLILKDSPETTDNQTARLKVIEQKLTRGMQPHPFVLGSRTVYGVMPDWNPAEMIGIRPKPLSLSLYRELITDATWAYQRNNYGYRDLRGFPLMPHFFGQPYIDVRLSFNSFIPATLDERIASRLVDYYIEELTSKPVLHDKVEFEIVFSCYTLNLPSRLDLLSEHGFSEHSREAISLSLKNLTNKILHPQNGLWKSDAAKISTLNSRREELIASSADPLERVYWLLEDARRYGTLPFAGLARAGFIAIQMLKSLVELGIFSTDDYDNFLAGTSTVSSQLARDLSLIDKTTFLSRYGHLRPGTYDITSLRYDEAPDEYFNWKRLPTQPKHIQQFGPTLSQMRSISELLKLHGLETGPLEFFDFIQAGIELREFAKFNFSRNLSDALRLIVEIGEQLGFSREDMSYCSINALKEGHISAGHLKNIIAQSIEVGKSNYRETIRTALPSLICDPKEIWGFKWMETQPNFITQNKITANISQCENHEGLAGSIVCIPNADPGFDWVFSHSIGGLITAWGGANSHMAIRAGELNIPAIIGAGEVNFKKWSNARTLHIDCAGRRVEILT